MNEKLFLKSSSICEWRTWVFEIKFSPGEDAMKIIEMTRKDLQYYILLVDKAVAGFERIDSKFWKKFYCGQNVAKQHCMLQRDRSWKEESTNEARFITVLFSEIVTATSAFITHHSDQSAAISIKARPSASKKTVTHSRLRWWLAVFSNKVFLK